MEDDVFDGDVWRPDVVVQRADALRDLAAQVDATKDNKAKALLIRAMERIVDRLSDPRDNVREVGSDG